MPMQDVSEDSSMINWLRQAGHGHLIEDQLRHAQNNSSPPLSNPSYGQNTSSQNYPPQPTSLSSPGMDALNRSGSFSLTDYNQQPTYGAAGSPAPPMISSLGNFDASSFNQQHSPLNFTGSPTQFLTPNLNDPQLDINIENMRRDPNTRVVQRPPVEDLIYKQRVFVRYLQPPTPPVGGTIIVREKQEPGPPPDPPIVIKRAPPPPPTPPPVVIRERPPPIPAAEGTTVIDKLVPPGPKPPRQYIIEQYPQLPQKPQDVIIERWLPLPPRQRRILYERLPPNTRPTGGRPIIVQYGPPHVRIQREVITTPGSSLPYQQTTGQTDINHMLSQLGVHHSMSSSSLYPSSMHGYNPYAAQQPSYGLGSQSPANMIFMPNGQQNSIAASTYGMPLTCVCTPNQNAGLNFYGGGSSAIPMMGQAGGQSSVYNVPDNVPIEGVLRQLGVDPSTLQRSSSNIPLDAQNAVSHVWSTASHTNLPDHRSVVSQAWNAASHANPSDHHSAVSNIWNAASHAPDQYGSSSPNTGRVWDRIENYLHHQPNDSVRSAWDHMHQQNSGPPPSNYPPPSFGNYSSQGGPSGGYPSQGGPSGGYPPQGGPSGGYPSQGGPSGGYPPPYGPPNNNPPQPGPAGNYSPPPPSSYPPAGGSGAGAGVLARLFGGGQ